MRKILAVILTALLFSPLFSVLSSQEEKPVKMFNLDVLNFYSAEGTKSRVDIYVEVPLDKVEFKRSKTDKSAFITKFDLTIEVKDKNDVVVYSNVSKEEITTLETKQEYLMQNSQILTRNMFLQPGEYKVRVAMYEQNTKNRYEEDKKITVKDYASMPLSISDVMIVSRLSSETGKKLITPDVARNVGTMDTFYLFYYVYKNPEDKPIDVNCKIFDGENKEVYTEKQTINFSGGATFQNQIFVKVPTENLNYGKFTVEISAASGSESAIEKTYFENENSDFPLPLKNIDDLIGQLQYIAKDEEMTYMRDGKNDAEKQKRFLAFWKKKDPSPNTKRNEVMQEYYNRIRIADKLFSTMYTKGWRSDMGMVFIIFGQPDNIDRHPYEMDSKPYEVWDYYSLNRQFIFVDENGFGDYRLMTPIWDTFRYNK